MFGFSLLLCSALARAAPLDDPGLAAELAGFAQAGPVELMSTDPETRSAVRAAEAAGRLPKVVLTDAAGAGCYVMVSAVAGGGWVAIPGAACKPPVTVAPPASQSMAASPASPTPPVSAAALVDAIVALPDPASRRARLAAELTQTTDADLAARLGAASAVLARLDASQRGDRTVVRLFLLAALSWDASVRAQALAAAASGGDPPMPAGAPSPAVPPPTAAVGTPTDDERLAHLHEYKNGRLARASLTVITQTLGTYQAPAWPGHGVGGFSGGGVSGQATWTVQKGGSPLSALEFATLVADREGAARLQAHQSASHTVGPLVSLAGLGLAVGGAAWLLGPDGQSGDYVPPLTLTLVGAGLGTVGVLYWESADPAKSPVAKFYSIDDADGWIDRYNAGLRDGLGLSLQDVTGIDLSP